jgi:hypothetical protein
MWTCTYCGCPADTLDHVDPRIHAGTKRKGISFSRDLVVPCCKDCNSTLSSLAYYTIGARAGYLHRTLSKRWKKALRGPSWTPEEMDELGYTLRSHVEQKMKLREIYRTALEHLKFVEMTGPTIADVWSSIKD